MLAAAVVAVLLLIAWLFFYKPPIAVDLAQIGRGDIEATVGDDGTARIREVYEVAAPVTGRLLRVEPEVGDPVVANETVLARLSPIDPGFLDNRSRSVAQAQLKAAEARLALDQAEVRRTSAGEQLTHREYSRIAALASSGTVSRAALDRARTARDEAIAALASARAAVDAAQSGVVAARAQLAAPLARDSGGTISLRAPVSGTVLQLFQKSESVVQAGAPVVAVGDPKGDLEIVADLVSTDAVRIEPGARVYVEQWGGSRPLIGRVRLIEPFGFLKISALGVEEQRVNVRIDLVGDPASWARLGHGYRVEVRIVTDKAARVLRVPTSALFRDRDQWAVFVNEKGRAKLKPVELGLMNDRFAEIRGGLREGEDVVLFPAETIREGTKLKRRG
jgi:HlyD family secretion protein